MHSQNIIAPIYPWHWLKMWFQFSVPERLRSFGRKPTGSDPIFPADPSWQNKKFLQEQPLELERLRSPVSTDSLLVIHPEDLESPEICKQIHTALQKKDRILLFKAFFADEAELLAWGREPAKYFKNDPYLFQVPDARDSASPPHAIQRRDLHAAIQDMAAGTRMYLAFSLTLAEKNPQFRAHLERILLKLAEKVPLEHSLRDCFSHSFLYHGNHFQALLHQAISPDFSFQIANSKYWRFVMHRWSPCMETVPERGIPGVWLSKHQLIHNTNIPYQEVLAEPGDILYFPEHLWHEVHNLEDGPGLMCGLRAHYPTRTILKQAWKRENISRALAWHKYASFISMTLTRPDLTRAEYQAE